MRTKKIQKVADQVGPPAADTGGYVANAVLTGMAAGLDVLEIVDLIDELERRHTIRLHAVCFRHD